MEDDLAQVRALLEAQEEAAVRSTEIARAAAVISTAAVLTRSTLGRVEIAEEGTDASAAGARDALRLVFPEAVTLVREALDGMVGGRR